MDFESEIGIVYLLTNPAMPRLVKIGSTTRKDEKTRMRELFSSGVPLPFKCVYAARVKSPEKVENALHAAFAAQRVNAKREFFEIDASQAIPLLKLLEIEDSTLEIEKEVEKVDQVSLEASKSYAKKRPKFNFIQMGIPIGSQLICIKNGEEAIVRTENSVLYKNQETSLTSITREILGYSYSVAPGPYWTYNGKRLREIYDETYLRED
jgi:hypothetical protein